MSEWLPSGGQLRACGAVAQPSPCPRGCGRSWTATPEAIATSPSAACAIELMHVITDAWGTPAASGQPRIAIPIAGLDPESIKDWANTLTCAPQASVRAVLLDAGADAEDAALPTTDGPAAPTAQDRVMAFQMASSKTARELARYLSVAAPLSFPVMRWIQGAMLPHADPSHLAEFVLGGLLFKRACDAATPPDEVVYDFHKDVRPLLQRGLPIGAALDVMQNVGAFIEANADKPLDLRTSVQTMNREEIASLAADARAFAEVSRSFLERMGLIDRRDEFDSRHSGEPSATQAPDPGNGPSPQQPSESRSISYRERVLDLQWSPTHTEMLAILTTRHVDSWNLGEQARGDAIYVGPEDSATPLPLLIEWWIAPKESSTRYRTLAQRITTLIAQGLGKGGWQPISISEWSPSNTSQPAPIALLVFETPAMDEKGVIGLRNYRKALEARKHPFVDASIKLAEPASNTRDGQFRLNLTGGQSATDQYSDCHKPTLATAAQARKATVCRVFVHTRG